MDADSAVFEGTPMAEYLHDFGIEDWGIEPPSLSEGTVLRSAEGRRLFNGVTKPLPLLLNEGLELRRHRFKNLVYSALQSKLRDDENQHFLERFRYLLVSSHLLENLISVYKSSKPKNNRKRDILFNDEGPWSIVRTHRRYWVGGGGCIVVIVVLLSWQVKHLKAGNSLRATTTLVLVLCIGIYLFAHSRRRLLRLLRAKAVAYASQFVDNNDELDSSLLRAIRLVHEVELLSQGYRPDLVDRENGLGVSVMRASHSRLAAGATRTSKSLRSAISATLYLCISSFIHGIKECAPFCNRLDLERCIDMYELKGDEEFGMLLERDVAFVDELIKENYYGTRGANATVPELKHEFHRLHYLRRVFMCCLLSITADGDCSRREIDGWTAVVDNLESCSALILQLARTLSKDALLPTPAELEEEETSSVKRRPASHLYDLAVTIENVESRLHLLNEEDEDYEENYELLGTELHHLLEAWEQGRSSLGSRTSRQTKLSTPTQQYLDRFEEASIISSGTTLAEEDDTRRLFSPREHMRQQYGHIRRISNMSEMGGMSEMTILEGIVEQDERAKKRNLSRKERIQIMQKNREAELEKRSVAQQRQNFVLELGNVLDKRRDYLYDT